MKNSRTSSWDNQGPYSQTGYLVGINLIVSPVDSNRLFNGVRSVLRRNLGKVYRVSEESL